MTTEMKKKKALEEMQQMVQAIADTGPQYRQYAIEGKLGLIDGRMEYIDQFIRAGLIKVV